MTKTLHFVPPNDAIGTLARVMTYVVFGVMGLTVILAVAAGMANPGQSSTGTDVNSPAASRSTPYEYYSASKLQQPCKHFSTTWSLHIQRAQG